MNGENYSLNDLSTIIKSARENSIFGLYERAISKFQIALSIIEKRIKETSGDVCNKWKGIQSSIKIETALVCEIVESCSTFKTVYEESRDKKNENVNKVNLDNDQDLQRKRQWSKDNEGDKDFLKNIADIQNIAKKVESNVEKVQNNQFKKSPDKKSNNVPSNGGGGGYNIDFAQIANNNNRDNKNQNRNQPNANNKNANNIPSRGGGGGRVNPMNQINNALNSYEPSKKMLDKYGKLARMGPDGYMGGGGVGSSKDVGKKGSDNASGKSAFLLHHYPNGEGPDSDLIEMLEREVVDTNPRVSFNDIAELDGAKKTLQEAVLLPLVIPDYFKGIRRPWRGVLLYGPPGTGKTLLAKALATQGKTTFFNVHSSSFASKWRGESEKLVRILFEMARFYAPTTIFIDEVDSLCSKRGEGGEGEGSRRVKAELLVQMEGVNSNTSASANEKSEEDKRKIVTVMAATNRPWDLDDALRRRFEKRVYIPLPNEKGRQQLFDINLRKINLSSDIDYDKLIKITDGYSGADISNVCREAALMPMRRELLRNSHRNIEDLVNDPQFRQDIECPIGMNDLMKAIENTSKSVSQKDLVVYDKWTAEFSSV